MILLNQQTFNIWVWLQWRSFAEKAGGKGDLLDNSNAAAPSCGKFDQDALTIASVSEKYPTAVICLRWVPDSFCIARRFWLPCHISKMSWTLAILWIFLSHASLFTSKLWSVFIISRTGSSCAKILRLSPAIRLTMTVSRRFSPVVTDCLQPIRSRQREKLASTLTLCGMVEVISRATLERSANHVWVSSC